jgi:ATP-dependent Lon protease
MSKDTKSKNQNKVISSKKKDNSRFKKKKDESSDSNYSDNSISDDEELDVQKYHKFLAKTFPSKHMDKKVKAGKRLKNKLKNDVDNNDFKKHSKNKKYLKNEESGTEEEEDDDEYDDDEEDEAEAESDVSEEYIPKKSNKKHSKKIESEEDDEEEDVNVKGKSSKYNIVFTIGSGKKYKEEYDDDEDEDEWLSYSDEEDDDEYETENEDDPISSDEEEDETGELVRSNKKQSSNDRQTLSKTVSNPTSNELNLPKETENSIHVLELLKEFQTKNADNELVTECIKVCEDKLKINKEKLDKINKKQKDRNNRIFKHILRDKNTMNDFEFFEKLEIDNQKKIIKELREINKISRVEKPYRLTLLESEMPLIFKSAALKKISSLRYMEPGSGEFYKIKNWVDTFMRIPFGNYKNLPISMDDGVEKCHDFMSNALNTLNDAVYGLNDAKMQIMQMLGQLVVNPKSIGTAIAIHGPPGTGKTSIVKEGISKILNRPFAFIALGGATDSSFLEGHGYTYEGSTWGKIVQILIDSKCMNPVIYFDELDKISDTPKGEEITGILTHLTDTSQNSQFHDKYFTEIDFDLSKCLFIFSYNDESKINPILKDRMYRIQTKGYNQKQKTVIANNYLLPKIQEQVRFTNEDIIIPDETLHYIIENFCNKEDGVRNLKRCLEIIYTKINLYRLMRPGSNLFEEDMTLTVEFPFKVTKDIVDKLVKNSKENISALHSMYM